MPKYTDAEWNAQLNACKGDMSKDQVLNMLFGDSQKALWREKIEQMHVEYDSIRNYLTGILPTREWEDWRGTDELGRMYHSPYIPFDMSIFQRSMQICDPMSASECKKTFYQVPRGGITNLPALKMVKTGIKTDPICIANIRTSGDVKQVAEMMLRERFAMEERVFEIFYTMALLQTLGHKHVLEGETVNGQTRLISNDSPYNALRGGQFSYMQPLFPAANNLNNILPLDLYFLQDYGAALARRKDNTNIAKGPRGERIYEIWHPDDWYREEVLDNQEYVDKTKYLMKAELLPGYRHMAESGMEKEIIGNFSMRQNDSLPRFAESTEGGLTIIQTHTNVAVDVGNRALYNDRDMASAPFGLACMLGQGLGEILTRPTLTEGLEGMSILPIGGVTDWVYRNPYDKECNPEENMPWMQKDFEMGFRMKNPEAGRGFIFRFKNFRLRPPQTCNLRPIYKVTPSKIGSDSDIITIGCNPLNDLESNNIMDDTQGMSRIKCSSKLLGDSASRMYRVIVDRASIDSIKPNQSPLECALGSTVTVFIGDADGDTAKQRDAVLIDYIRPNSINPNPVYIIQLASVLSAGECVQYIGCKDATPNSAVVVACNDSTDDESIEVGTVKFVLDSSIPCNVGATVLIKYYDEEGTIIDTAIEGTIVSVNPDTMTYVISSEEEDFGCLMKEGQASIKIECD